MSLEVMAKQSGDVWWKERYLARMEWQDGKQDGLIM